MTFAVAPLLGYCDISEKMRSTRVSKRLQAGRYSSIALISERFTKNMSISGTLFLFILASIHVICFRGILTQVHADNYVSDMKLVTNESMNHLAMLAEKHMTHQEHTVYASRLAACGFWTTTHKLAPLKHLLGLLLGPIFPFCTSCRNIMYPNKEPVPTSYYWMSLVLNLAVLNFCRGIPQLTAAALIALLLCALNALVIGSRRTMNKMSI